MRWSLGDTLSHNKEMLRNYLEPVINNKDGYIIHSYHAYAPFSLKDPRHLIFWKTSVAYFGDPDRFNFIGNLYAPQVVLRKCWTSQYFEKRAKAARTILEAYKTDPSNHFRNCAEFASIPICEEEDRWLSPWANRDVTREVCIRDLIPMNL